MIKTPFHAWIRLEQPRFGGRVTYATDEFFGARERLIDAAEPVFIADKFDDHGKWMDGWETRRKRAPGHDYCIIRLGLPGRVRGFDVDTTYFSGNFPPEISIDGCVSDDDVPQNGWTSLVDRAAIRGNTHNFIELDNDQVWTHVRLSIFPDGGIARLHVYGKVEPRDDDLQGTIDLVGLQQGGRALSCSDEHFGSMHNLNMPGRGINMGDGWETARRRGPGHDWVIMALGIPGQIERIEVDTAHFKGNYPDRVALEAARFASDADATSDSPQWQLLLPESKVSMHQQHYFDSTLEPLGVVSHVRLSIYPDGGVSRLRLFGQIATGRQS